MTATGEQQAAVPQVKDRGWLCLTIFSVLAVAAGVLIWRLRKK